MDDIGKQVLIDSNKIISKLQLLSTFFGEEVIYKIYVRSQVIHKLFENNPELDIYKLNLFHLQFTESVIELLRRIKKSNEKNASLILDEMALNDELIQNLVNAKESERSYDDEIKRHVNKVNLALRMLYQNLSELSATYPFNNTQKFGVSFARDHFTEISQELFDDLSAYNPQKIYQNDYAIIDKKLMGLQCRYQFNNTFHLGLKCGTRFIEVFKIAEDDIYFTFNTTQNHFLLCDYSKIAGIEPVHNGSRKEKVIVELRNKNSELEYSISIIKTKMPPEVKVLLEEYYEKIKGMNFLDFIDDLDIQTNILKVMLDTKTM
jgi:hypothetical protein